MENLQRLHIEIQGAVQGVGFRPFIFRLANEIGLKGWVLNSSQGVFIEAEGLKASLDKFLLRIEKEKPPRSYIQSLEFGFLDPAGFKDFQIHESRSEGAITALVLPDIAVCPDCISEIFDPSNRRYLYPFTNCTNCGPRFSIIESLPYDRLNTTMSKFIMCNPCKEEYLNPLDRRFHAQPNACPTCGPQIQLWDRQGIKISDRHDALLDTCAAIISGKIAAIKGLGGFHLIADARNENAVTRLRTRKHREEKPLALMYPSLESVKADCEVSGLEERLLISPESPIVLMKRKSGHSAVAPSAAPNNPYLGIMLPYTPLHHILMKELSFPVVATSGNISDEPICTDEKEALERLAGIADVFLVHNRPIRRHVDDSVVRIMMGRELVLRRSRGYAPLPVHMKILPRNGTPPPAKRDMLAVGAHLKNTVALFCGDNLFISQHIGDLETKEAFEAFQNVILSFKKLYRSEPAMVLCDMHPGYLSSQYAKTQPVPHELIQHHYAHVASCMAENFLEGSLLGVSWDGTGYGPDGTIWGGEFLVTGGGTFRRAASLRQFRLPGSDQAVKEPRRSAIGILYELYGEALFSDDSLLPLKGCTSNELNVFRKMLEKNVNSPLTSSMGRLFDAVSSIIGLRHRASFEGQAAMELEFAAECADTEESYQFRVSGEKTAIIDWGPMIREILGDVRASVSEGLISAKFHNTLAEIILAVARLSGEERVVLTGGCFQNKYLTERTVRKLQAAGLRAYWHQRIPPNDGGIAMGQIAAALMGCTSGP